MDWFTIFAVGIFCILFLIAEELQFWLSKRKYEKARKEFDEAILRGEDVDAPIWIKPSGAMETNANDLTRTKKFRETCEEMNKLFPQ